MTSDVLQLGNRIACLPVIHGSGDFALAVRRVMLEEAFDCMAVPLPPSFQADVERGIELLPVPTMVVQRESVGFQTEWSPEESTGETQVPPEEDDEEPGYSY